MKADLEKSVAAFRRFFPGENLIISYPFGSHSLETKKAAQKLGFEAGMTTVKNKNENLDSPLELGRFDCVDLFPRKKKQ